MANVTVRIPAALREFSNGRAEVDLQADTVASALGALAEHFPLLAQRVTDPGGAVRPYVNVFVGETSIRDASGLDTALANGDVIAIIPAVAGGWI